MSETITRYTYWVEGEAVEEDDLPETGHQFDLAHYLVDVLKWLFRYQQSYISGNMNIYPKGLYKARVAPDIYLVKGVNFNIKEIFDDLKSYQINPPKRPAPSVVFEISSEYTALIDVQDDLKPKRYGEFKVKEYFAYDAGGFWGKNKPPLKGWRYNDGQPTELFLENGRMWSEELDSWLVPDDTYLRLYDKDGNMRLTKAEQKELDQFLAIQKAEQAEYQAEKEAELARQRATQEIELAQQKAEQAELARQKAEKEAELAKQQTELARQQIEELLRKLKQKETDPDSL